MPNKKPLSLLAAALILAGTLIGTTLAQESNTDRVDWQYAMLSDDGSAVVFLSPDGDLGPVQATVMLRRLADLYGGSRSTQGIYVGLLNAIGRGGWELVSVDGLTFIFKRPR